MFYVTDEVIKPEKLPDPRAGGVVFFEGRVRNHNEGFQVRSLEYQCYRSMALKEGQKIIQEALDLFCVYHLHSIHREGHLKIGDIALWVGAGSAHRKEAFLACQYVIDHVKARVPIWKKEHYVDRPAEWIACHRCEEIRAGF